MSNLRKLVLKCFKNLHRTSLKVFDGDKHALVAARLKINEEFHKNKNVKDEEAIKAMMKLGDDVANELRSQVIQARQVKPGVYEARITDDTLKLDNMPFNDDAISPEGIPRGRKKCCQEPKK